jgi:hypothetical protein
MERPCRRKEEHHCPRPTGATMFVRWTSTDLTRAPRMQLAWCSMSKYRDKYVLQAPRAHAEFLGPAANLPQSPRSTIFEYPFLSYAPKSAVAQPFPERICRCVDFLLHSNLQASGFLSHGMSDGSSQSTCRQTPCSVEIPRQPCAHHAHHPGDAARFLFNDSITSVFALLGSVTSLSNQRPIASG